MTEKTGEVSASGALLWRGSKRGTRGPKPAHSLEQVLDAAIRMADAEGLAAVSMQRLAQDLGFTKMAVYRYVPGRQELIALMTDRALGPPPGMLEGETWRQRFETWAMAVFGLFCQHPWALQATSGRRIIGPIEADWIEQALTALAESGLNGAERLDVIAVTTGHVRSMAEHAAAMPGGGADVESEMGVMLHAALKGQEGRYPELLGAMQDVQQQGGGDNAVAFGLACILDGVEWLLASKR